VSFATFIAHIGDQLRTGHTSTVTCESDKQSLHQTWTVCTIDSNVGIGMPDLPALLNKPRIAIRSTPDSLPLVSTLSPSTTRRRPSPARDWPFEPHLRPRMATSQLYPYTSGTIGVYGVHLRRDRAGPHPTWSPTVITVRPLLLCTRYRYLMHPVQAGGVRRQFPRALLQRLGDPGGPLPWQRPGALT
jgi:hypothetical protein